jgi:ubiquinone/menaquinone biosynthesis C-methylase UbiE
MQQLLMVTVVTLFAFSASIALFFFVLTRGTLLVRALSSRPGGKASSHVYPIYSNMRLIKLIDYQFIISAILLFQYHRLVRKIVSDLGKLDLENKTVLITSCAFGNVIPEIVKAALQAGAARILVTDIIKNELIHAQSKLGDVGSKVEFIEEDATAMQLEDGAVDVNIIFFLLHELPHHLKQPALHEASRLLAPGGKLFLAEFHRPDSRLLRLFSWAYFKVFEPYGLALWDIHDPLDYLLSIDGWSGERYTCFNGNFQVISAMRS